MLGHLPVMAPAAGVVEDPERRREARGLLPPVEDERTPEAFRERRHARRLAGLRRAFETRNLQTELDKGRESNELQRERKPWEFRTGMAHEQTLRGFVMAMEKQIVEKLTQLLCHYAEMAADEVIGATMPHFKEHAVREIELLAPAVATDVARATSAMFRTFAYFSGTFDRMKDDYRAKTVN